MTELISIQKFFKIFINIIKYHITDKDILLFISIMIETVVYCSQPIVNKL